MLFQWCILISVQYNEYQTSFMHIYKAGCRLPTLMMPLNLIEVLLSSLFYTQKYSHTICEQIFCNWNAQSAPSLRYFTQSPITHYPFVKFLKDHVCWVYVAVKKYFFSRESFVVSPRYSYSVSAYMNILSSCHVAVLTTKKFNIRTLRPGFTERA